MRAKTTWFWVVFLITLGLNFRARADIYVFKDKDGVLHFTDTPTQSGYRLYMKTSPRPQQITDGLIKEVALKYHLPPALVKAIIKVESDFNPKAVSNAGAIGLMQLKPETAKEVGITNPYSPYQNLKGGVRYLKRLIMKFGNLKEAIAAYYVGPGAVKFKKDLPEVKKYVNKVLYYYNLYRNEL